MAPPVTAETANERLMPAVRDMERLGAAIAARLRPGDTVCLWGPLGAGKSTLARGLIRALTSPEEEVPSPTFTLVQSYDAPRLTVAHFDLYRLTSADEAFELGLDEALEAGAAVIEWPERLQGRLPEDRLDVVIAFSSQGAAAGRLARLQGHGSWSSRADQLENPTHS